jgi:peptide chain release factor subunit 1
MLDRKELKEIAALNGKNSFVSLYLNVDPAFNTKGDYMVHFKNMMKTTIEKLDKSAYKKVREDLEKIDNYVRSERKRFKKGLALLSSSGISFWKEYHMGVPVRNELIINNTPYTQPLLDILDNYEKFAVLLVDKESARIFGIHMGEIVEYSEVHTTDIPGKQKKGGWFALSQDHYERHVDYHVGMHIKNVMVKLNSFLSEEGIGRLIIGGSDEAVSMTKGMLHKTVLDKVIGDVKVEMFAGRGEVLKRVEPVVSAFEKRQEDETVETLISKAMKNENAVLGLDNVLNALQEQRVMKLVILRDYKAGGYICGSCGFLTGQKMDPCPYCKGKVDAVDNVVDTAGEKAIQQGALVDVVSENKKLREAGGIGAFLRF